MIAVSDSGGGIHNPYGLDVPAAIAYKAEHGVLEGFPGADAITNEELIEIDCDVLTPCALEQVITVENASRVRAKMICEGANGPTTPAADEILEDRGILVLPDVLANAGGVVVSYFEWVQGLQEYFWKEYEVNAKLNDIVVRAFEETWSTRERFAHEHAHGRVRDRGSARRRGDDDPRPLPVASASRVRRVTLYHAEGCHLCDRAHRGRPRGAGPDAVRRSSSSTSAAIDALEAEYREHLPVIEIDGVRAFTYFVTVDGLLDRLGGDGSPAR